MHCLLELRNKVSPAVCYAGFICAPFCAMLGLYVLWDFMIFHWLLYGMKDFDGRMECRNLEAF